MVNHKCGKVSHQEQIAGNHHHIFCGFDFAFNHSQCRGAHGGVHIPSQEGEGGRQAPVVVHNRNQCVLYGVFRRRADGIDRTQRGNDDFTRGDARNHGDTHFPSEAQRGEQWLDSVAEHTRQAVVDCRACCTCGRLRPAYQAPQNYGKGEDNRTGAFEEGFYPVPQAGHDVFEVGRAESRQLHQERELLHVAFHTRQAFHDIRCQGGRQDAYEIEDEQRQSLQVENPAYGAIRNDGGDNQRVNGQPRGAGQQRGDGDGNEAFARVINRTRRHHGGNGTGETRQERDE